MVVCRDRRLRQQDGGALNFRQGAVGCDSKDVQRIALREAVVERGFVIEDIKEIRRRIQFQLEGRRGEDDRRAELARRAQR